jgi:cytosine/adenosine deaminase-related metal-dependent hydrolase
MGKPLTIRGARIWDARDHVRQHDLYCARGRIVDKLPRGAQIIDLEGYTIFPALINAHDHLELNHFPRIKFRDRYDNAHQWGEDVSARLDDEPFKSLRAYGLKDRCFIGGLKNLLCGALTVAHHNPPHKCLFVSDFPVRVLRRYGWAHSLHFSSEEEIVRSYRATPPDAPWFIHLAEGTDEIAAGEYRRLKALGCVGKNTVIVHGMGMTDEDIADAARIVRGLVVCPTTNCYLLGKTADVEAWMGHGGRVWIGSDSRLTADGDLLDELNGLYHDQNGRQEWRPYTIDPVGTPFLASAPSLNLSSGLSVGCAANWIIPQTALLTTRADLALVVRGGVAQIGDPDVMAKFPHVQTIPALLDGVTKRIHIALAKQIARCTLREPGLELDTDFVRQHM